MENLIQIIDQYFNINTNLCHCQYNSLRHTNGFHTEFYANR